MFTEEERAIYVYNDGTKDVHADPLAIRRRLIQASTGQFMALLPICEEAKKRDGSPADPPKLDEPARLQEELARQDAQEKIIKCIRSAFKLPELDETTGKGVTEFRCWTVFWDWWEFLSKNANRGGSSANSSSTSDSPPASS